VSRCPSLTARYLRPPAQQGLCAATDLDTSERPWPAFCRPPLRARAVGGAVRGAPRTCRGHHRASKRGGATSHGHGAASRYVAHDVNVLYAEAQPADRAVLWAFVAFARFACCCCVLCCPAVPGSRNFAWPCMLALPLPLPAGCLQLADGGCWPRPLLAACTACMDGAMAGPCCRAAWLLRPAACGPCPCCAPPACASAQPAGAHHRHRPILAIGLLLASSAKKVRGAARWRPCGHRWPGTVPARVVHATLSVCWAAEYLDLGGGW
jgi:hypothetical protein